MSRGPNAESDIFDFSDLPHNYAERLLHISRRAGDSAGLTDLGTRPLPSRCVTTGSVERLQAGELGKASLSVWHATPFRRSMPRYSVEVL